MENMENTSVETQANRRRTGLVAGITEAACCGCFGIVSIAFFLLAFFGALAAPGSGDSSPSESASAEATTSAGAEGDAVAPVDEVEQAKAEAAHAGGVSGVSPKGAPELKQASSSSEASNSSTAPDREGTALAQLRTLQVKGRAPKTGYDRDSFGWRDDVDRNGCDTLNDILRRDIENFTTKAGTNGCVVISGTVNSPYSGTRYAFVRNPTNTDIDHVVALSDACLLYTSDAADE